MSGRHTECPRRQSMQYLYDGVLTVESRSIAEGHRASCPECAREYADLARLGDLLHGGDPGVAGSDAAGRSAALRAALLARCADDAAATAADRSPGRAGRRVVPLWRKRWLGGVSVGLAAAAAVGGLAILVDPGRQGNGGQAAPVRTEARGRASPPESRGGALRVAGVELHSAVHPSAGPPREPIHVAYGPRHSERPRTTANRRLASRRRRSDRNPPDRIEMARQDAVAWSSSAPSRIILIADASSEEPTAITPSVHLTIVASGDTVDPAHAGHFAVIRTER